MNNLENREILSKYTLLLVDDDELILNASARSYSRYFQTVHIATNGCEAIELYDLHKPDLVISDISMPLCSGESMAKQIRDKYCDSKIIFTTGYGSDDCSDEICKLSECIVTKPINMNDIIEIAVRILSE